MDAQTEISLANRLDEIPRLLEAVRAFADACAMTDRAVFELTLAVDELVTNTIAYGYADGAEHRIVVRLARDGDALRAELVDDGAAFNPLERTAPELDLPVEERPVGGLGIHFVRTMMDEVHYRRDGAHNRLVLVKRLGGG